MIAPDGELGAVTSMSGLVLHFWNIPPAIQQISEHSVCIITDHLLGKLPQQPLSRDSH